jgi:hypothetical protein
MTTNIERIIEQGFEHGAPPAETSLTTSRGDEELEDTKPFRGKNWEDLDPDILPRYQYALFWFTPEAFHYYLPAFLRAGVTTPHAVYVTTLLQLLQPTNDHTLAKFRKERWGLLTDPQIEALEQWLYWLLGQTKPGGEGEVEDALRVVRDRFWWKID